MNKTLLIAAAAAAYLFRSQLEALLLPAASTAAPAPPGVTTPIYSISPPAVPVASAPAPPAAPPPAPVTPATIAVDSPDIHNFLAAFAAASTAAGLARAQTQYGIADSAYLLNINQWNWYNATATGSQAGIIPTLTSAGDNAIPASQYLALRQSMGLV
jgi:hypothetical protein